MTDLKDVLGKTLMRSREVVTTVLGRDSSAEPKSWQPTDVIVVRFVGVEQPGVEARRGAAIEALPETHARLPQHDFVVDLAPFRDDIEADRWQALSDYLTERASSLRSLSLSLSRPAIHVFAVAEVPALIAFGAYIGDSVTLNVHDHDRDSGNWLWPDEDSRLRVRVLGTPDGILETPYDSVIRVGTSYQIPDADVDAIVEGPLADVQVVPRDADPHPHGIRSAKDAEAVARAVREAIASVLSHRPRTTTIHLIASVRASVAIAIGRELKIHNLPPVQLYRFRSARSPHHSPAIRLGARDNEQTVQLTQSELEIAAEIRRGALTEAFADIKAHAAVIREAREALGLGASNAVPWFAGMRPRAALTEIAPFPELPSLGHLVQQADSVDPIPKPDSVTRPYAFDKDSRAWRLTDRLVVAFWRAAGESSEITRTLFRAFFYHEYLHDHHSLTKTTAEEIGSFANGLQYLDYLADSYALAHELDFSIQLRGMSDPEDSRAPVRPVFLAASLDRVIRSFWAFEPKPPVRVWQERRVRRYLNWYWRHVQLKRAVDHVSAFRILSRQPQVEFAGLKHSGSGRYVFVDLANPDPSPHLALGIVLDDETFARYLGSPNAPLRDVLDAFIQHDHEKLVAAFGSIFDFVQ